MSRYIIKVIYLEKPKQSINASVARGESATSVPKSRSKDEEENRWPQMAA
jgi:hypothetical protein